MKRQVRTLICLLGSGLVVFGGMEIGLEFMRRQIQVRHQEPGTLHLGRLVVGSILLLLGIVLLAVSRQLSEKITGDFEE